MAVSTSAIHASRPPPSPDMLFASVTRSVLARAPLSYAQQGIWMRSRLSRAASAGFNMPIVLEFSGEGFDSRQLEQALHVVVSREEALRTVYPLIDGIPCQQPIDAIRLSLAPETVPSADLQRLLLETVAQPFCLETEPPIRARLFAVAPDRHVLCLVVHHIACDARSVALLLQALRLAYAGVGLVPHGTGYLEFARQQREAAPKATSATLDAQRQLLGPCAQTLRLPVDYQPDPSAETDGAADARIQIPAGVRSQLQAMAARSGCTEFVVLLAAHMALLSWWSGQDRFLVASPTARREEEETEELVGCFASLLPLPVRDPLSLRFDQLVTTVRDDFFAQVELPEVPSEKLAAALGLARAGKGAQPLSDAVFTFQNVATGLDASQDWGGVLVRPLQVRIPAPRFGLLMTVIPDGAGLIANLEYNPDTLAPATAERLLATYLALLEAASAVPDAAVRQLFDQIAPANAVRPGRAPVGGHGSTAADLPAPAVPDGWNRAPNAGQSGLVIGLPEVGYCLRQLARVPDRAADLWQPVAGALVAVCDRYGLPVGPGQAGELCAAAHPAVAGYAHSPRLTAERFVPAGAGSPPGSRLFRTGLWSSNSARLDQAVWTVEPNAGPSGLANQAEPGEMPPVSSGAQGQAGADAQQAPSRHQTLTELLHRAWCEALGLDRCDPNASIFDLGGDSILCLKVVAAARRDGLELGVETILEHQSINRLVGWLLQQEAKSQRVDPAITADKDPAQSQMCPYTERLKQIWSEVLGASVTSVDDSIFDLGGDSILCLRAVVLCRQAGIGLELEDLLEHQSIARQAAAARSKAAASRHPAASGASAVTPLANGRDSHPNAAPDDGPVDAFALVADRDRARLPAGCVRAHPVSALQAGMLFHARHDGGDTYCDVLRYWIENVEDPDRLFRALIATLDAQEVMHSIIDLTRGSEPLQIYWPELQVQPEREDLTHLDQQAITRRLDAWLDDEVARGFRNTRAGLVRARLFVLGAGSCVFGISFHHAVMDGLSEATIVRQLVQTYERLGAAWSGPVDAPAPVTGLQQDFVALERAAVADPAQQAFWQAQLERAQPMTLPPSEPAAEGAGPASARLITTTAQTEALLAQAATWGVPLKSLLLAWHARVLSRAFDQPRVATGMIFNGRPEVTGAHEAVGMFLNTLPVWVDVGGKDWEATARAALEAEIEVLPNRRFPLARLQALAGGVRPFAATFNYTHFLADVVAEPDPAGLRITSRDGRGLSSLGLVANFVRDPSQGLVCVGLDAAPGYQSFVDQLAALYRAELEDLLEDLECVGDDPDDDSSSSADTWPCNDVDRVVAALWGEILLCQTPHPDDDFFRSGGDSVRAMQFIAHLEELFGIELPVALIFKNPSLRAFSAALQDDPAWTEHATKTAQHLCAADPGAMS